MISYTIAIDKNDNGSFGDAGDAITLDVLAMHWRLGMAQPYEHMAAPIFAEITVTSPSGSYSPEQTALLPGKRLRIQSSDGITTRTHLTGFIDRIDPLPGTQGKRTALIHVQGVDHWLRENIVRPEAQIDVHTDDVIDAILHQCKMRYPVLAGYLILNDTLQSTLGNLLFGDPFTLNMETGNTLFAYTGDMWGTGVPADVAIRQYVDTERGHFFISRDGAVNFYNRQHLMLDEMVKATFTDSAEGLDYSYGAGIVNQIEVRVTPRSVGRPGSVLWSLTEPQKLSPGVIKRIVARYTDSLENPMGALFISYETHNATLQINSGSDVSGSVLVRIVRQGAGAATLEIENTNAQVVYLNTLSLYGTPLLPGASVVVTELDAFSQTWYGFYRLTLDLPALTSVEEATGLAQYELIRRRTPQGTMRALHTSTTTHPTETLALTLFDRITLTEAQTGNDRDYFIVAEEHHIDQGGYRHRVTWLLEPASDDVFFILDRDQPDGTHYLMY